MAFVARRRSDGKVVDRQAVSWKSTMPISDISDEDDTGSMLGYTNRTLGAPETVRFVGDGGDADEASEQESPKKAESDSKVKSIKAKDMVTELKFQEDCGDVSGSDVESIMSFCQQLDEEEASDMMYKLMGQQDEDNLGDQQDLEDLDDTDKESDIMTMMGKPEDIAEITDTETMMNANDDSMSLSSFDSYAPTVTGSIGGDDNLDNLSGRTYFTPSIREETTTLGGDDNLDNLSGRTYFTPSICEETRTLGGDDNLDNISGRTYFTPSIREETRTLGGDDNLDNLSGSTFFKPTIREETKSISQLDAISEASQGQISSRTFSMSTRGSHRILDDSSVSTCSWTDMYGEALQPSDNRSNVVPSLSLASASSDTSTFYKNLEEVKERHGQAAYEDWKARKEAQKQQKILAAKREREKREAETALRQKLAQERFQEWCRRKEQQQQKEQKAPARKLAPNSANLSQSSSGNSSATSSISGKGLGSLKLAGPARQVAPEVTKSRLKEWERLKLEQQQRERERLRKKQEFKKKQEDERKMRSQGAWNNWMKQVDRRAKPVPLNQGFDTLRGTISNIYINPVQWVSNIDTPKTGRSH
ncbi:inner centromere protein A [Drosophila bipectinata]|uniref:inner centromere protein A n=1 Tax=Drosophila bipectinata TaxID=42026 RepID=UPI001C8A18CD|nr:inner centromere protein A [Drosophila bipectinata]XP_017098836.2 inner centromere protein A [Drosophila bipectinata]